MQIIDLFLESVIIPLAGRTFPFQAFYSFTIFACCDPELARSLDLSFCIIDLVDGILFPLFGLIVQLFFETAYFRKQFLFTKLIFLTKAGFEFAERFKIAFDLIRIVGLVFGVGC